MELSFGQRIDETNGLVECWFTHGALDWIKQQDWSNKKVLEYGSGMGDIWLSKRVKYLISIERNQDWAIRLQDDISTHLVKNYEVHYRPIPDEENMQEQYIAFPKSYNTKELYIPDIIIIDDAYRLECIKYAVSFGEEFILILDNYMQAFVCLNTDARDILVQHEHLIFEQHDHQDHDGVNKWKTGIFFINKKNNDKDSNTNKCS
jgi:hypothetical protein